MQIPQGGAAGHLAMQARDADVLLARALLALHQPRRALHAHDQVACADDEYSSALAVASTQSRCASHGTVVSHSHPAYGIMHLHPGNDT